MNKTVLAGQWKQIEGAGKRMWGKLTDDDWKVAEGNVDLLAGRIQELYGHTKEDASIELGKLVARFTETK